MTSAVADSTRIVDCHIIALHSPKKEYFFRSSLPIVAMIKHTSKVLRIPRFIDKNLIEEHSIAVDGLVSPIHQMFEDKELYNWTRSTMKVVPLIVPDHGFSLFHSISILIFGIPDGLGIIEECFLETCQNLRKDPIYYFRWENFLKKQYQLSRKKFNKEECEYKWKNACSLYPFQTDIRQSEASSDFTIYLKFYLFLLAQICRRAIIVVGEKGIQSSIYLPLQWKSQECVKCPIFLTYHQNKFNPLAFVDEIETDLHIADNCFPITLHTTFKLFQFPFLNNNEHGIELLKNYSHVTSVGYTTGMHINELEAVRVPMSYLRNCEPKLRPNKIMKICFNAFNRTGDPSIVASLWNYASETTLNVQRNHTANHAKLKNLSFYESEVALKSRVEKQYPFNKNHVKISNDRSRDDKGLQTRVNERSDYFNFNNAGKLSFTGDTPSDSNALVRQGSQWVEYSIAACNYPDDAVVARRTDTKFAGVSEIPHSNNQPYLNDGVLKEGNFNSDNKLNNRSRLPNGIDTSLPATSTYNNHSLHHQHENIESISRNGVGPYNSVNALTLLVAANHLIIRKPSEVNEFVSELKITDEAKVVIKLSKDSSRKSRLYFRKLTDVQINYQHTNLSSDLELFLFESDDHFQLNVKLPSCIIAEEQLNMDNVSTLFYEDNDLGNPYVDVNDHQMKCKTGGCMGYAMRQYRNLCASCHESWLELNDPDFHDDESVNDTETDNSKCKTKDCDNVGEAQYHGFCHNCFHSPNF